MAQFLAHLVCVATETMRRAATLRDQRRELGRNGVKACVRALIVGLGGKCYNLSEGRPGWKRPAGLPDLWVMFTRPNALAFWVETKTRGGEQSAEQVEFQNKCYLCGVMYVVGGEAEVRALLERHGLLKVGVA